MIHMYKTPRRIDRIDCIDCTARKALISRVFVRAVLSQSIDRQRAVTDRHRKYKPRIDRLEMSRFAGLSSPLVIAVDAVGILISFTDGL